MSMTERMAETFEHEGLTCGMAYHLGAYNGYVKLLEDHPYRHADYDDIPVHCHGGLTYGPDDDGWVGFDTLHAGDVWGEDEISADELTAEQLRDKSWVSMFSSGEDADVHWTKDKLRSEIKQLAEQLAVLNRKDVQNA